MIARSLEKVIKEGLGKGKAIIVLGPRQVGKTTLVKHIAKSLGTDHLYLNGDITSV